MEELLSRPTTDDDTHPSPKDRFALVSGVMVAGESSDVGTVWELFTNPNELTAEMTARITSEAAEQLQSPVEA